MAPPHKQDFAQAVGRYAAVAQRAQHRFAQARQQRIALDLVGVRADIETVLLAFPDHREARLLRAGQSPPGPLRRVAQALVERVVFLGGLPELAVKLAPRHVDQHFVEVLAAKARVARSGPHLDHAFENLQDGDVERASAQVEHEEARLLLAPVQAVGEGGRRRFID